MFELNKKQVNGLIKILDKHKGTRPVMSNLFIDKQEGKDHLVAVATDGFVMAIFDTELSATGSDEVIGKGINLDDFRKWYAVAGASDRFTVSELPALLKPIENPLPWQRAIPTTPAPIESIALNSDLMKTLETVAGEGLVYTTYGQDAALIADTKKGRFLLMPIKTVR
jgi:hypothetical protein